MITVIPRIRPVTLPERSFRERRETFSARRCAAIWVLLSCAAWAVTFSMASALASAIGL